MSYELPEGDVPIWGAPDSGERDQIVRRLYTAEQVRALLLEERGRCARVADEKAEGIARVNTYRGKVNQVSQHAVEMVESVAAAIRKQEP